MGPLFLLQVAADRKYPPKFIVVKPTPIEETFKILKWPEKKGRAAAYRDQTFVKLKGYLLIYESIVFYIILSLYYNTIVTM